MKSPHDTSPSHPRPETVGIIDVGSNTIKLLVAKPGTEVPAEKISFLVEETRIGEGMTGKPPTIDQDAISRGSAAIERLVRAAEAAACDALCIVATAAVREAANKQEFVNAVEKVCGHELRILSGYEEAILIGLALRCDPALTQLTSYSLIDLGGGSLECIQFSDHIMTKAQSLPIGSVRVAASLIKDRAAPLSSHDISRIQTYVKEAWQVSNFRYKSSPSPVAVLTGGAAKHLAASFPFEQREAGIPVAELKKVTKHLCKQPIDARISQYQIPASRADIFPTAALTLVESLDHLGCERIYFSEFNLRFGIATSLLAHGSLLPPQIG